MTFLPAKVECYDGYRGQQEPRRFDLGRRRIEVVRVLDRWIGPDHRYFKVLGSDGCLYVLRHDERCWSWEVVFFSAPGPAGDEDPLKRGDRGRRKRGGYAD